MEDVRRIVAEFAARDKTGAVFKDIERKFSSFQKTANNFAKIGRATSFVYLVSQLDNIAASLQKASYNGENFGLALLKSLPIAKQIDDVTSNIAKSLADIATHGQITSNEKLASSQSDYKKLFDEMSRMAELSKATAEDAAKIRIENSYKDRIKEIEEWSKGTQELTKHNELLKNQIQELESEKKKPVYTGITSLFKDTRTKSINDIDKEIAALQDQILTYDISSQKANLLAAAEAERSSARLAEFNKILDEQRKKAVQNANTVERMYADMGMYSDGYWKAIDVQLNDQVRRFKDAGASEVLAEKWKADQLKKINEDIARSRMSATDLWVDYYSGDNVWDRFSENWASGLDGMSSKLTEFYKTGKMDWDSWTDSLLTSWIDTLNKMALARMQQAIIEPAFNWLAAGITAAIGNIGAGGSAGDAATGSGAYGGTGGGGPTGGASRSIIMHSGGIVGHGSYPTKNVNPSIFANAPRLHSGLKSDEFPAILQKGEAVIPKNQVGNSAGSTNVKVIIVSDMKQAAIEAMNTPEGEKVQIKNMMKNRKLLG